MNAQDMERALLRAGRAESPRREVKDAALRAALGTTVVAGALGSASTLSWLKGAFAHGFTKAWMAPLFVSLVLAGGTVAAIPRVAATIGSRANEGAPRTKTASAMTPTRTRVYEGAPSNAPARERSKPKRSIELSTPASPTPAALQPTPSATPSDAQIATMDAGAASSLPTTTDDVKLDEHEVLSEARAALSQGDPTGALIRLYAHAANFPESSRTRERDYLRVRALVSAGRRAEAEAHAARFLSAHPRGADADVVRTLLPNVARP